MTAPVITPHREILRKADEVVERAQAAGALDRRAFMRLSTLGLRQPRPRRDCDCRGAGG